MNQGLLQLLRAWQNRQWKMRLQKQTIREPYRGWETTVEAWITTGKKLMTLFIWWTLFAERMKKKMTLSCELLWIFLCTVASACIMYVYVQACLYVHLFACMHSYTHKLNLYTGAYYPHTHLYLHECKCMRTHKALSHTHYTMFVYTVWFCRKLNEEKSALKEQLESERQKRSMADNLQ